MKTPLCAAALVLFAIAPFAAHAVPCDLADDVDVNRARRMAVQSRAQPPGGGSE